MTNKWNRVLYVGISSDLVRRVFEHKERLIEGFTCRYNTNKLVYFETFTDPIAAIQREKQIKNGSRKKKIQLIERKNSGWDDLYHEIASL